MSIIKPLPSWAIINRFPGFYEGESLTAIEQTARVYVKMNELIDGYNKYIEQVNAELMELETQTDKDLNCAVKTIINLTDSYINMVDLKLSNLDRKLADNYSDFTANVVRTITGMVEQMRESGELDASLLDAVANLNDRFTSIQEQWESKLAELNATFQNQVKLLNEGYSEVQSSLDEDYKQTKSDLAEDYKTAKENLDGEFHRLSDDIYDEIQDFKGGFGERVVLSGGRDFWHYRVFGLPDTLLSRTIDMWRKVNLGVSQIAPGETGSNTFNFPFELSDVPVISVTPYIVNDANVCVAVTDLSNKAVTIRVSNLGGDVLTACQLHIHVNGGLPAVDIE